jgi:nucleoid DNA-binding protein
MTKVELAQAIAEKHNISPSEAGDILNFTLDKITETLERGQSVQLRGFGSFAVKGRLPRIGRNPKTGEALNIPAKKIPIFKFGSGLKQRIEDSAGAINSIENLEPTLEACQTRDRPQNIENKNLFSHLTDIRDCTTFLWRRLQGLKDGDTDVSCMVREITFNCVTENLHVLSEAGLFKYDAKSTKSREDNPVLNLRLSDISPDLKDLVQQAIKAA